MYDILAESRVIKNDEEIDVMRAATALTVEGHIEILK
jgi:Xaa-Pro aminopeptidase